MRRQAGRGTRSIRYNAGTIPTLPPARRPMTAPPLVSDELLQMLRCPQTHSRLARADEALVERLNQAVQSGQLANQIGERIERPLRGGLVNEHQSLVYPVYDHGPTLVVDEAITLPLADS